MISIEIKKLGEGSFTDRTDEIQDVSVTQGTTKEATTGTLMVRYNGAGYIPSGEDQVEVYDGEEKIFGGFIVRVQKVRGLTGSFVYQCDLKNKVHLLDRKLVNKAYAEETVHDIILDIVDLYSGAGITTDEVEDDPTAEVKSITFANVPPSEAIQQLAEIFGKEWYVDPDGDIHFFSKFSEEAPFDITDTNKKAVYETLSVVDDYTQIRNSVLVLAGDEISTDDGVDEITVVGDQKSFPLTKKYASGLTATVNGTPVTIGAANLDSFDDYDALYDFNTQSIAFEPGGTVVEDGDVLVVTGKYYFPIAVRYNDSGSIATFGRREYVVNEKSIKTRTDAISRAKAELAAYAQPVTQGEFETYESGLRAGQKISIVSPSRGIDAEFVIQRLSMSMEAPTRPVWSVEVVSVKSFELIDLLAQIVKGNRVSVAEGTVIANAERLVRDIAVQRDFVSYFNSYPIWVAGPYEPTSLADRNRVAFTDRGALTT